MTEILPVRNKSNTDYFSCTKQPTEKYYLPKHSSWKPKNFPAQPISFQYSRKQNKSDNGNPSLIVSAFASPAWKRLSNPAILLHKSECTKTLQLSRIIDNRCLAWVFENQEETSEADWNIICRHVASSWRGSRAKTQTVALSFHL